MINRLMGAVLKNGFRYSWKVDFNKYIRKIKQSIKGAKR